MLKFNPLKHVYYYIDTLGRSVDFISVTTKLKKFDSTDWDQVKADYAIKNGLTIQEVTELWDSKAKMGTYIHACKESEDTGESIDSILAAEYAENEMVALDLKNLPPGVYNELILYSNKYRVAGKADKIVINPDRTFTILDYKTDKEINFKAFYEKGTRKLKMFNFPLHKIENCNWNKYNLQISVYAYMLECYGYTFVGGEIEHIICKRDVDGNYILKNNKPIILETKRYATTYLKNEAKLVLKQK